MAVMTSSKHAQHSLEILRSQLTSIRSTSGSQVEHRSEFERRRFNVNLHESTKGHRALYSPNSRKTFPAILQTESIQENNFEGFGNF